jgi:hypothetical protein
LSKDKAIYTASTEEIFEDLKSVKVLSLVLMFVVLFLSMAERIKANTMISFPALFEIVFILMIFKGYIKSLKNFNYGFWGFSAVILIFIFKSLIVHSLVDYNQLFVLMGILGLTIFTVNSYTMSSPIYYPRVQWWEYDYKYRADLKIKVNIENITYSARLSDLRRSQASIEAFEVFKIGTPGKLILKYDEVTYELNFEIKSFKNIINGRPNRYGLKLDKSNKSFSAIKKIWSKNKKVKLRSKFK